MAQDIEVRAGRQWNDIAWFFNDVSMEKTLPQSPVQRRNSTLKILNHFLTHTALSGVVDNGRMEENHDSLFAMEMTADTIDLADDPVTILADLQDKNGIVITAQVKTVTEECGCEIAAHGGNVYHFVSSVIRMYLCILDGGDTSMRPMDVEDLAKRF